MAPFSPISTEVSAPDRERVRQRAQELGFDLCGFTGAEKTERAEYYQKWIEENRHGEMGWMNKDPQRRSDPQAILPGARSIIILGLNYYQPHPSGQGRVARYALGEDYHAIFEQKLDELSAWLSTEFGGAHKRYCDTGPILEKPLAQRAGLGWQGKSTMLIHEKTGPWLLLGEIITSLQFAPDAPAKDRCGKCTRCIDACPTQAITGPYQLDARRCIAYLTIELKGSIPEEFRPMIGNRIYGCDECLEVCPWNKFAKTTREARFISEREMDLHALLEMTPEEFNARFKKSPIARVKRRGLLRNVCVALGNIGTTDDLVALEKAAQHEEPLVREHAEWAIEQIKKRI